MLGIDVWYRCMVQMYGTEVGYRGTEVGKRGRVQR